MRSLLALLLLIAFPAAAGWVEGSVIGVRDDNSKKPTALYLSTTMQANDGVTVPMCQDGQSGRWCQPAIPSDVWVQVDVTGLGVPVAAKSVFLSGLLIISHGFSQEVCGVWVAFRAPGDDLNPLNYVLQVVEAAVGSGQRSNAAIWAPLKNGKYEVYWHRQGFPGDWPTYCSLSVNMSLQAYIR